MSDFPAARFHKPVLGWQSLESVGLTASVSTAGSAVASINVAYYMPLAIAAPYLVRKVWWCNGATTIHGNVDVGVYTAEATPVLLFSSGATAQATADVIQSVTLGTPFLLTPGQYYMAFSTSSSSATFLRSSLVLAGDMGMFGYATQATAHPLPATATLAVGTLLVVPIFGIASATVI